MSYINIKTTQNVEITYETARLLDRILAFFIDFILIFLIIFFYSIIISKVGLDIAGGFGIQFGSGLIFIFYSLISETVGKGASLGKRALKLKVIKLDGKEPSIGDYFIRWVFRFVDIVLSAGTGAMFTILSGKKSPRIGDLIANTTIIKTSFNKKLNISALDKIKQDNEVVFPESKFINEEFALVIKNVLDRYRKNPSSQNLDLLVATQNTLLESIPFNIENHITTQRFLQTVLRDYVILSR